MFRESWLAVVSQVIKLRHGHCSQCGNDAELFVLELVAGEPPLVCPLKRTGTQVGMCERCLTLVQMTIAAYFASKWLRDAKRDQRRSRRLARAAVGA